MWDMIVLFFSQPPPALDPTLIPWLTALIAGNIIIFSAVWAFLKYVAKATPWAGDDKILQILTGAVAAVRGAVSSKKAVDRVCDEHVADGNGVCEKCGHQIE
jgi:hypothetical protein